jgi:predicted MPP superfamily phosphohydrolase
MKIPAVLSFLGIVLLILGVIHAYLNLSFVTFLEITSPAARKILAAVLGLLAVSFVLSTVSVRMFPGAVSQVYYGVSALWFGAALYLALASIPVWPVAAAVRWLPLPGLARLPRYLALFLYGLTALFVVYNVANAHRVRVTRFSVDLKNLPDSWRGKTVAHLSDLHLGAYWDRGFLDRVARKTVELRPDIIVITGDLFDGSSGGHERFLEGLRLLDAPQGVYFISGNHEVYAGLDKTLPVVGRAGIRVIDDTLVTLDGLQLIGIASPAMENSGLPAFRFAGQPDYDRNRPSILLYHTPTDINGTSLRPGGSNSPYLSPHVSFQSVIEAGVSLQLSGHTHGGQFMPFTWLTERIYGGYHYGLKRIGDFQIYIHSGTGTWAAPFRSGSSSEIALITLEKAPGTTPGPLPLDEGDGT